MAAPRLNDSQKSELVGRYRALEASQALAEAFGCSVNTVSRVVKAALEPTDYERIKAARSRAGKAFAGTLAPLGQAAETDGPAFSPQALLAIDDADDFAADLGDGADELDDFGDLDLNDEADAFVEVPIISMEHSDRPVECLPLSGAPLPASIYMLVDKTVELQARPLKEFSELGRLPADEAERQALIVFSNPRQAKRHCGRSQRVIKVPDSRILERTAPYLLAQGISRVVLEGSLYSLPGS